MSLNLFERVGGKRGALARVLSATGGFALARRLGEQHLTIFNYHRISKPGERRANPYNDEVVGPTQDELRDQLKHLLSFGTPITENDLIEHVTTGRRIPRGSFMVTMDDGYLDHYELAMPVFLELKIPAMFFIPTDAIINRTPFWWDQIDWCLKRAAKETIPFRDTTLDLTNGIKTASDHLNERVKIRGEDFTKLVQDLAKACETELASNAEFDSELMSWENVLDAHRRGITIGSHTHTHPVLVHATPERQREELASSKRILEEKRGAPVRSFAYPVGGHQHFSELTKRIAKECGYSLAFSFLTGSNRLSALDPMDVRRMDRPIDLKVCEGTLSLPRLFPNTA